MTTSQSIAFAGLPGSGKTTYLALLYRAITDARTGDIRLGTYSDDREYVNEIVRRLERCEPAERTLTEHEEALSLSLIVGNQEVTLRVPDLSGERWRDALEERRWSLDLDAQIREASGLVVFVHADDIETEPTLDAVEQGARILNLASDEQSDVTHDQPGDTDLPRVRATQVALVDLLQLAVGRRPGIATRVSVIASAWDLVPGTTTPDAWLADELPLLDQFLDTNGHRIAATMWGVSAQGGDFIDDVSKADLLEQDVVERATVKWGDGQLGSIEAPIRWALGCDSWT